MRVRALASDYDGTLATDGTIPAGTIAALVRLAGSGRRLVLVTGRVLAELRHVCPRLEMFDVVVAEDGAVMTRPRFGLVQRFGPPPPPALVSSLSQRDVQPLVVGEVLIGTTRAHEATVREQIAALELALEVHLNKSSLMVLPPGVDKGTGVKRALRELGVDPLRVAAVGDGENDQPLLRACGIRVAVANAAESLKPLAAFVTSQSNGQGMVELIDRIIRTDLR